LRLRKLTFRLIECRLKWPGIDLKQDLTALYDGAFPVILLDQVAGYLGLNLRIDISVERSNPVAVERHVALFDRRHANLRWSSIWRFVLFLSARRQQQEACGRERRKSDVLKAPHPNKHLCQQLHFPENVSRSERTPVVAAREKLSSSATAMAAGRKRISIPFISPTSHVLLPVWRH
jgi:hypothetical protein